MHFIYISSFHYLILQMYPINELNEMRWTYGVSADRSVVTLRDCDAIVVFAFVLLSEIK